MEDTSAPCNTRPSHGKVDGCACNLHNYVNHDLYSSVINQHVGSVRLSYMCLFSYHQLDICALTLKIINCLKLSASSSSIFLPNNQRRFKLKLFLYSDLLRKQAWIQDLLLQDQDQDQDLLIQEQDQDQDSKVPRPRPRPRLWGSKTKTKTKTPEVQDQDLDSRLSRPTLEVYDLDGLWQTIRLKKS